MSELSTRYDTKTVQELVDLFRRRRLNLEPSFQRQSVWSDRDRRLLVKSVMEGIPLPAIYLYARSGRRGAPTYDVIDGKQRLETLLLFMDQGPLAAVSNDWLGVRMRIRDDDSEEWWYWDDLVRDQRHTFLSARVPTIEVEGELGEVIELFVRINSTGKRLTGAERRHAYFYKSPVLKVAQSLADGMARYFVREGIIAPGQLQRMKHVELVTELILAVDADAPLNKKSKLDTVIAKPDLLVNNLRLAARDLKTAIRIVDVILPDLRSTRFHRLADYYTLVLLVHRLRRDGYTVTQHDSARNVLAGSLLREFGHGVDRVSESAQHGRGVSAAERPYWDYLMTVREGTDSKRQRERREALLREVLAGVFEELDTRRTFNPVQRRIVWNASRRKLCEFCGQEIARWEEMSVDHIEPFIRGGRTKLGNARLAHKRCNAAAGAR